MIALVALLLLAVFAWLGVGWLPLALIGSGALWTFVLSVRVLRASVGGVGGHAEWVRDVSTRPRLSRSPAWSAAVALIATGAALGLWERW
jgi:hypothetical protein